MTLLKTQEQAELTRITVAFIRKFFNIASFVQSKGRIIKFRYTLIIYFVMALKSYGNGKLSIIKFIIKFKNI